MAPHGAGLGSIPTIFFKTTVFLGSAKTEYSSLNENAMDIFIQTFCNIFMRKKKKFYLTQQLKHVTAIAVLQ